jgi:hypothetical protein
MLHPLQQVHLAKLAQNIQEQNVQNVHNKIKNVIVANRAKDIVTNATVARIVRNLAISANAGKIVQNLAINVIAVKTSAK